jgi:hypothetical protein
VNESHDGAEADRCLADVRERFVIDQQASAETSGAEGLLDGPALRCQHKAFDDVRATNDLDGEMRTRHRGLDGPV